MAAIVPSRSLGLLVLGMHRSGTSAITGALSCLGVHLGSKLYAGHENVNAKGYFENSDIADLNDEVLLALDSHWDSLIPLADEALASADLDRYSRRLKRLIHRQFDKRALWAVKDPRVCRLLPWWIKTLDQISADYRCILVIRHPSEVVQSLQKRDGFAAEKALMLWIEYNLLAERHTRGRRRTLIAFDKLLEDPVSELERIERDIAIRFPDSPSLASGRLREFLSNDLKHHSAKTNGLESEFWTLACDVHKAMIQLANSSENPQAVANMDDLTDRFGKLRCSLSGFLWKEVEELARDYARYRLLWIRIARSWSWLIGKPIRFAERKLGRDV